jgi:hypothetical protein
MNAYRVRILEVMSQSWGDPSGTKTPSAPIAPARVGRGGGRGA